MLFSYTLATIVIRHKVMNTNVVIGGIILLFAIVGAIALGMSAVEDVQDQTNAAHSERSDEASVEGLSDRDSIVNDTDGPVTNETTENDDMSADSGDRADEAASGSFSAYSPEKLALAADGDVVLFFKASWCPSCRALEADIRANMEDISPGLTILEVDFDSSTELKQRYGVTTQHTLVQVDQYGEQINKWIGGNTLNTVEANII